MAKYQASLDYTVTLVSKTEKKTRRGYRQTLAEKLTYRTRFLFLKEIIWDTFKYYRT